MSTLNRLLQNKLCVDAKLSKNWLWTDAKPIFPKLVLHWQKPDFLKLALHRRLTGQHYSRFTSKQNLIFLKQQQMPTYDHLVRSIIWSLCHPFSGVIALHLPIFLQVQLHWCSRVIEDQPPKVGTRLQKNHDDIHIIQILNRIFCSFRLPFLLR